MKKTLTDSELLVLGLVSEMPRHGYELEIVIEQRGMREWTEIGFSSIYFVLGKLEKKKCVKAHKPATAKAKKSYSITKTGRAILVKQTMEAIRNVQPSHSPLMLGMIHWSLLTREQALSVLQERSDAVATEIERLEDIQLKQQPLPDYVDAMFEFSMSQLQAEAEWVSKTLAYMETKPWN